MPKKDKEILYILSSRTLTSEAQDVFDRGRYNGQTTALARGEPGDFFY